LKIGYKIWLDNHGKAFGEGPYALLKRVLETSSLHRAARQMGMSYSKAWRLLHTVEKRLGVLLLERKIGGSSGGGSKLTVEARDLVIRYERFRRDAERSLEEIYQRHFGSTSGELWK